MCVCMYSMYSMHAAEIFSKLYIEVTRFHFTKFLRFCHVLKYKIQNSFSLEESGLSYPGRNTTCINIFTLGGNVALPVTVNIITGSNRR
jgi:hypothetical protein